MSVIKGIPCEDHGEPKKWKCKICRNLKSKEKRKNNPDLERTYTLRKRYGITSDAYNQHLAIQEYKCLVCLEEKGRLVVDHNHKTGAFRGLLCDSCNHYVGYYENNPQLLPRIVKYVSSTPEKGFLDE